MINIKAISKDYAAQTIFNHASLAVHKNEKIGLLGKNGEGKTTLLRLITNEESCDDGEITIPKNYTIGYLKQHRNFTKATVLEQACENIKDSDLWEVEKILSGLGFEKNDFEKSPELFSDGYKMRISLTNVLAKKPDMLLLDEPTNFLDIPSIRWFANFLRQWESEFILISHDQNFMNTTTTHIAGIYNADIRKIKGTTQEYYAKLDKEEEILFKQYKNQEKKKKQTEKLINKFRAKASKASMVQSRIRALEKEDTISLAATTNHFSFSFSEKEFKAKQIMSAEGLKFAYTDEQWIIENISLTVEKNDKIFIIGKNGKGKSTLLKLLSQKLTPAAGEIKYHPSTAMGFFEHGNTKDLNENLSIEDELISQYPGVNRQLIRNICGAMMFSGDHALKKISVLSGGEKSRVMLARLLIKPSNLIFLDEPTHHLDINTCEALSDAIVKFNGAAFIVTHNEEMLFKAAEKLIVFSDDGILFFRGGYQEFLDKIGWAGEENTFSSESKTVATKKENRHLRAQFINERSRTLKPLKTKMDKTEEAIIKQEETISDLNEKLIEASNSGDVNQITALSKSLKEENEKLNILYNDLEDITLKYEETEKEFKEREKEFN